MGIAALNPSYALVAVAILAATTSLAQNYPAKPIRLVVLFTRGRCVGSRRGGRSWGGDGARPPGLWRCTQQKFAVALVAVATLAATTSLAQNYPAKPIRLVVLFT